MPERTTTPLALLLNSLPLLLAAPVLTGQEIPSTGMFAPGTTMAQVAPLAPLASISYAGGEVNSKMLDPLTRLMSKEAASPVPDAMSPPLKNRLNKIFAMEEVVKDAGIYKPSDMTGDAKSAMNFLDTMGEYEGIDRPGKQYEGDTDDWRENPKRGLNAGENMKEESKEHANIMKLNNELLAMMQGKSLATATTSSAAHKAKAGTAHGAKKAAVAGGAAVQRDPMVEAAGARMKILITQSQDPMATAMGIEKELLQIVAKIGDAKSAGSVSSRAGGAGAESGTSKLTSMKALKGKMAGLVGKHAHHKAHRPAAAAPATSAAVSHAAAPKTAGSAVDPNEIEVPLSSAAQTTATTPAATAGSATAAAAGTQQPSFDPAMINKMMKMIQ